MPLKDTRRLAIFMDALYEQKDRLAHLLRSIKGLGFTESMKPSVFRRFMMTLRQIAEAKDAETNIINQIDAMEARHRKNRANKSLREATPLAPTEPLLTGLPEVKRPEHGILWLAALWLAFKTPKPTHK